MLALFLVLGAIINVAVAWGCCLYGYRDTQTSAQHRRDPTPDDLSWWRSVNPPPGVGEPFEVQPMRVLGYWETRYLGHGPVFTPATGQPYEITSSANWNEAGWPVRSLKGVWFGIPNTSNGKWTNETRGAFKFQVDVITNLSPKRSAYLPWHPRWPGFAINTLFYAFILWLMFAAPFALRRRRRIKRGLCVKCAYPVGTNEVCTECGAAVVKQKAETA